MLLTRAFHTEAHARRNGAFLNNESYSGQSEVSVASNVSYFLGHLSEYHASVANIDTYKTLHQFISKEVAGVDELLDIGNGGVFDYETSGVKSITAIDLFLGDLPPDVVAKYFPQNCRLIQGSALALPERDGKFDMVLMVMLIHHLTSTDWRSSWENAGRLLIVESCVPWWFFRFEKPALWFLSRCVKSIFSHPITLQFPASMIKTALEKKTSKVKITEIPKGKFILQFGFKIPSFLTPARPFAFEAIKD